MTSRPARRARATSTVAVAVSSCRRVGSNAAVCQPPAVILDVGHLEPVGAERHGEIDDLVEMLEVLPVYDRIDGQRQPRLAHQPCHPALGLLRARETGDPVARGRLGILQAELDVLEPGIDQTGETAGV